MITLAGAGVVAGCGGSARGPATAPRTGGTGRYQIVYQNVSPPGIYVMNDDGTGMKRLTTATGAGADGTPVWFEDGSVIAFERSARTYLLSKYGPDQWEDNPDRFAAGGGIERDPSFSPHALGDLIASSDGRDIWVMRKTRNGPVETQDLTTHAQNDDSVNSEPTWSPDGSAIAFVSTRLYSGHVTHRIWTMNVAPATTASTLVTVTNVVARTESAADDVNPAWSRNGLRIAFSSTRDDAQGDIYTVRLQDGMVNVDLKRVTKDVGYLDAYPAWSPDSLSLAFVSSRPDPGGSSAQDREIWIEDATLGDNDPHKRNLTKDAEDQSQPDWEPFAPQKPEVHITVPTPGDSVPRGEPVTADFTCFSQHGGARLDVAHCVGHTGGITGGSQNGIHSGDALPTGAVGVNTLYVDGTNQAGYTTEDAVTYNVTSGSSGHGGP